MQSIDSFSNDLAIIVEKFVFLAIFTIIFYLFFFIFKEITKKFRDYSPNTVNGFMLLIDIIELIIWSITALLIFNIRDPTFLIGGSALIVTIISLSSSSFGSNIVGGLYLILTRPFGIGDLVTYNSNVGLVVEIGLNYTKILRLNRKIITVPNASIINSNIQNFNIKSKYVRKKKKKSEETQPKEKIKLSELVHKPSIITTPILDSLNADEVISYAFPIELRVDEMKEGTTISEISKGVSEVLSEFNPILGFEPEFYLQDFAFRLTVIIIITAKSSKAIFTNHPLILEKLTLKFYDFHKEVV